MKLEYKYHNQGYRSRGVIISMLLLYGLVSFSLILPLNGFAGTQDGAANEVKGEIKKGIKSGIQVELGEAPEDDLALTLKAIRSAKKTLLLNIYELSSQEIAKALAERIEAGVQVDLLEEGEPVGGMSAAERSVQNQLVQAMKQARGNDHFYEMTSKGSGGRRRFRYNHAKYAVIDGQSLLVGSENYSPTGNPSPQTTGNRGWEVFVHSEALARHFATIFQSDCDLAQGDLIDVTRANSLQAENAWGERSIFAEFPPNGAGPFLSIFPHWGGGGGELLHSSPRMSDLHTTFEARAVDPITAPDTSLSGLLAFLNSAKESIDLELMSFNSNWFVNSSLDFDLSSDLNPDSSGNAVESQFATAPPSPMFEAILSAARRGVRVRVLLNDESVFSRIGQVSSEGAKSKPKNKVTADALNRIAASENLNMVALIADVKAMGVTYIHNKGGLVDRDKTLISSINWNESAVERNREAAVVLTSPEIHDHYLALFEKDWKASGGRIQ